VWNFGASFQTEVFSWGPQSGLWMRLLRFYSHTTPGFSAIWHILGKGKFHLQILAKNFLGRKTKTTKFAHCIRIHGVTVLGSNYIAVPNCQNTVPLPLVKWRYRALRFLVHFSSFVLTKVPPKQCKVKYWSSKLSRSISMLKMSWLGSFSRMSNQVPIEKS